MLQSLRFFVYILDLVIVTRIGSSRKKGVSPFKEYLVHLFHQI